MRVLSKQQARAQGLTRYFTGKPCKRGHIAERMVSSRHCVVCLSLHNKKWSRENKHICTAMGRSWRERNREKVRALKRGYYARNPRERELQKKRSRQWMEANRPKYREASAKWRKANLPTAAAAQQRRRAKLLKCLPPWADHEKLREFYVQAQELTESTGIPHEVDHIYPLQGQLVTGLHIPANLRVIPKSENRSKGARLMESDNQREQEQWHTIAPTSNYGLQ